MGESVHQLLDIMFFVCSDGFIICKEHVSYGGLADLGLCSESCDVVQLAICSCMHVHSFGRGPKGMFKKGGGEGARECPAVLLLIGCLHVIVERSNHTVQIRGASDLQEDVKKPIPANQVKCLG